MFIKIITSAMAAGFLFGATAFAVVEEEPSTITKCEVTDVQPEWADFFVFGGRKAPAVGDIMLLDFTQPTITEITYEAGGALAFNGDILLNRGRDFSYSGIRYGMLGTYLAYISGRFPFDFNNDPYTATIRLARGGFDRHNPDALFVESDIHSAELLCTPPEPTADSDQ